MILIVTVDDRGGMMFNNRRQSMDSALREKMLSITSGSKLWVNRYTANQFRGFENSDHLTVDDDFLKKAAKDEFCFAENVLPNISDVDKLIMFKWNRKYPFDFGFDLNISDFHLTESEDFAGTSHEKITMEVYNREKV